MTTVLWVYYSGFVDLIESRRALASLQVETAALSDQNFKVANVDSLTGLPNRRHFFAELKKCSRLATVPGAFNAVGVIDLDHFKAVNDGFGHAAGDSLLKVIALRLGQHSHADFVVARLGGDEFGLLIRNVKRESDLEAIGEQLCCDLIEPVVISEGTMFISASIGLSVISQGGSGSEAYESADYALYDAKRNGKARSVLFTPAHRDEIRKAVKVARAIEKPGFEKELMVAFQPIVDIYSGDVVAFEALARWHSEELGDVSPAVFIAAAERSGLIGRLTSALLAKALKAASTWPTGIRLSFNLSANDITSTEGMTRLISVISRSGFDPSRIDFEITETAALIDLDQAKSAIRTLKAWGVGISLDDFGTGYSSLTQVHQLAVDKIKIDRSFVVDITSNPLSCNIVKSVIALSRDMNIGCIVEGVETQEALECLKMLGCSLVQGYYIAKPMLSHDVTSYLDHVRQRPAAA